MFARDLICIPGGYMVERLILKFYPSTSDKRKTEKLVQVADFACEFLYLAALILARRFTHLALNPQKHSKITPTSQSITQRHASGKFLAQKKSRTRRDLVACWSCCWCPTSPPRYQHLAPAGSWPRPSLPCPLPSSAAAGGQTRWYRPWSSWKAPLPGNWRKLATARTAA